MITIRKAKDRGHHNFGWLDANHSFSFGEYYDPAHMGFRDLRVINEDFVQPAKGFPTHPHRDMEIITYVLDGALEHRDSMGNGSIIFPGDVQYMSAGSGVTHSEFNHSKDSVVHLLQIWILPNELNAKPRYDQKSFSADKKKNCLLLVASMDGREESISIRQDVNLFCSILDSNRSVELRLDPKRFAWVQVAKGELKIDQFQLYAGDGVAIERESILHFTGGNQGCEFLVFDLK